MPSFCCSQPAACSARLSRNDGTPHRFRKRPATRKVVSMDSRSTLFLSLASMKLPDALQTLGLSLPPESILPLRIIAPLAIYSLGMTVVLTIEVLFFRSQRNLPNKQPNATYSTHTGTWIDGETHYCAKCWQEPKYSPMQTQKHYWHCPSCDTYHENPDNPYP